MNKNQQQNLIKTLDNTKPITYYYMDWTKTSKLAAMIKSNFKHIIVNVNHHTNLSTAY